MVASADHSLLDTLFPSHGSGDASLSREHTGQCQGCCRGSGEIAFDRQVRTAHQGFFTRWPNIRVDLEVVRVIKGKFADKEVTLYDIPYPVPERFRELSALALMGSLAGGAETFEWELVAAKLNDDVSVYSLNSCNYSKFSDEIDFR